MKHLSTIFLLAAFAFSLGLPPVGVCADMTLRVGTYENRPLSFLDESGNVSGFLVDLMDHIAAREGWQITYRHGSWRSCLEWLDKGEIDLLGGIAFTPERDKKYDYTYESAITEWGQIYIHPGSKIDSILDLNNKKIAVLMDDQHFSYLKNQLMQFGLENRYIESFYYEDVLALVEIGKCDVGLVSHFFGFVNAERFTIKKSAVVLSPQRLHWAARQGQLAPELNQLDLNLRDLKRETNGFYSRSMAKWFDGTDNQILPSQFKWVLIIFSGVLLVALGTILLFKAQVKHRTLELHQKNQALVNEIRQREHSEQQRATLEARLKRAEKMEAIGTLASGVAHDLNNILSGIVSYPELLMLDLPKDSPMHRSLATIKDSGDKAARVVQDLLTLARRGVPSSEPLNINTIVRAYLGSPEYEKLCAFHPRVEMTTELDADLFNINGSVVHLQKTVMNLVANAVEAMPEGGQLTIRTANRYIDMPIGGYDNIAQGNYVEISVSDTGIGISKEDQERIFEPFFTKKKMGRSGTGLGMAVVWGTVKDHNGYIDVQSAPSAGSTISLYFPITKAELMEEAGPTDLGDLMGGGERILVVDDVAEQREIATFMLQRLGYRVATAVSGEQAVEMVRRDGFDLVLLDMIMAPGIDGLQTFERLLDVRPGIRAVIASGFSETDRVRRAQSMGAGEYLKKPYTIDQLGSALKKELAHS